MKMWTWVLVTELAVMIDSVVVVEIFVVGFEKLVYVVVVSDVDVSDGAVYFDIASILY